jgi:uncharacterized protein YcbX
LEDQWLDFIITANTKSKQTIRTNSNPYEGVIMKNVKACTRCKMPTVNQTTGKIHNYNNVKNEGKLFHVEPYVEGEEDDDKEEEGEETNKVLEEDEPIRTLRQFRTGKHIQHPNLKWKDEVFFGVNLVTTRDAFNKSIYVGDLVTVLQKQDWVTWEK